MMSSGQILFWLTLVYGLAVPVIAVVYWRAYGPTNFLWLSDIGLALTFGQLGLWSRQQAATRFAAVALSLPRNGDHSGRRILPAHLLLIAFFER
jgi:hypothetical protein